MENILSKFTTHYQKVLGTAFKQAALSRRVSIEAADLLVALICEKGSLACEILEKHHITLSTLQEKLGLVAGDLPNTHLETDVLQDLLAERLTPTVKNIIEKSVLTAWQHQHHYIGSEHLLFALVNSDEVEVRALWTSLGTELKNIKSQLSSLLKSTSKFPDLTEAFMVDELGREEKQLKEKTPALDFFCTDLTSREMQNKIDPVVGREREIGRLINILARRTKNNPLLLGDPGVGKTAIVEGLAKRIAEGVVPEFLQDKKIFALDLGLVVAGTMYRGEFEGRLKQILDELKANPEIILFIDEIHTIIGTGSAPGTLDLANMLKPALAKGLIRCIGATTQEEYKKSIESDAALERRFQVVQVLEPSPEETIEVLKGLRHAYETFHQVQITDEAIIAAVQMSERYLPEKFLPDKAIDLLDEAASFLKTKNNIGGTARLERELKEQLKKLMADKEIAIKQENFDLATTHQLNEKNILHELKTLNQAKLMNVKEIFGTIARADVAQIINQITGVPASELEAEGKTKLVNLESILNSRVIGQNQAVAQITQVVKRARLGLGNTNKPIGSFLFLGPSGVGKTELAKLIAEIAFEDKEALVRLDMSEFAESFNISKMIGAPAGYVGYKESNKLTDQVRRKPSTVVLFDEIEKAHPDIFNLLLQILDEGHLTDAAGKKVNFKNTLIIMTSNLGLAETQNQGRLGFGGSSQTSGNDTDNWAETKVRLLSEVKKFFKPEFLNRLEGTIIFNPLGINELAKIVELQVAEINDRLLKQKINCKLTLARGVAIAAAKLTYSPDEGARALKRFLQTEVEDRLSEKLLVSDKLPSKITIKVKNGKVELGS